MCYIIFGRTTTLGEFIPSGGAFFQRGSYSITQLGPRADGRCKTLDASADGYVRSEAAVVLVLRALAYDGSDPAHGLGRAAIVLLGSAVNQDGRSSSLTAPNGPAQQAVVRAALLGGSLAPGSVDTLHLHGTGTALGDPIEVGR